MPNPRLFCQINFFPDQNSKDRENQREKSCRSSQHGGCTRIDGSRSSFSAFSCASMNAAYCVPRLSQFATRSHQSSCVPLISTPSEPPRISLSEYDCVTTENRIEVRERLAVCRCGSIASASPAAITLTWIGSASITSTFTSTSGRSSHPGKHPFRCLIYVRTPMLAAPAIWLGLLAITLGARRKVSCCCHLLLGRRSQLEREDAETAVR